MRLTLPLLVPASSRCVPWVSYYPPYGKNEQRPIASRASGVAELSIGGRRKFKYVRVWQPSQAQHAALKTEPMGLPALVLYLPYRPAPHIRKETADEDLRAAQRPALLCESPGAAGAVYTLFGGYKKCAHCGELFVRVRKDQTSCGKPNCRVAVFRARHGKPKRKRFSR